jgi:hypothetical protein
MVAEAPEFGYRPDQCRHAVQYEACKTEFATDSALEGT